MATTPGGIRSHLAICLIAIAPLTGCGTETYRAETVLHADGRITRAIFQPREQTPDDVRDSEGWTWITASIERPAKRWQTAITQLPDAPEDDKHPYFAASGNFPDFEKLPRHFVAQAPEGLADGRLETEVVRIDYLFVIEQRWLETLTDSISLPDVPQATAELADFCGEVLARQLERELGNDYDVDSVRAWARDEGRKWITALALSLYEVGVQHEIHDDAKFQRRLAAVCVPFGLRLTNDAGEFLEQEDRAPVIEEFLRQWMESHCKHRTGTADLSKFDRLIHAFLEKRPPGEEEQAQEFESRLNREREEIAIDLCGGKEALESRMWNLKTRICGLYALRLFQSPRRFHYSLKVPGRILSTNGERVSAGEVEWSFEDIDAFPLGYRMECRALVADVDMQKRLLGARPLITLEAQREFVRLASANVDLLSALRACRESNDLAPLERYRDVLEADSEERKSYVALWSMLKPDEAKSDAPALEDTEPDEPDH